MVENEYQGRRFRVIVAERIKRTKRWRRGDPVIGKHGLSTFACRVEGTKTFTEHAKSPVEILARHHSRTLLVEPVEEDGATFKPQVETLPKEEHTYFAYRPHDGRTFLLLVTDGQDPLHVAQSFFKTRENVELFSAEPEDFCQRAHQLHRSGVRLNQRIRRYAGIRR